MVARRRADRGRRPSAARRSPRRRRSHLVDVATGDERRIVGGRAERRRRRPLACPTAGSSTCPTPTAGSRSSALPPTATTDVLTSGEREHGEPRRRLRLRRRCRRRTAAASSTSTSTTACVDLVVGDSAAADAVKRGRGRPPKTAAGRRRGDRRQSSTRGPASGGRSAGCADGAWLAAIGESETGPQDLWLLPVPGVAPDGARPRQVTDSLPAVLRGGAPPGRACRPASGSSFTARDGLRIEGTLWRPAAATGKRGGTRVPTIVYPARRPDLAGVPLVRPFKQLLVARGLRVPRRRLPRLDRLRPRRSATPTTTSGATPTSTTWSTPRAGPPTSPGRTAGWRSTAARTAAISSCARSSRSRRLWRAGVDLYGDSEIAESFRHGDRPGRLDLAPDDGLARRPGPEPTSTGAARRSTGRSGSRRRC